MIHNKNSNFWTEVKKLNGNNKCNSHHSQFDGVLGDGNIANHLVNKFENLYGSMS